MHKYCNIINTVDFNNKFLKIKNTSMFITTNEQSSSTSKSISTSLSKRVSPSTLQQAISMLKKQLREIKIKNQQDRQDHAQQIQKYKYQIQGLKKKIIYLSQKQYLKNVLNQDEQQNCLKIKNDQHKFNKQKVYVDKLQNQLKEKQKLIQTLQQQILHQQQEVKQLFREKQKHLQLSILQKISLQQRIQVLESQIHSKQSLLSNIHINNQQSIQKQLNLKKHERNLLKKQKQLQNMQKQLIQLNKFQKQKLKLRINCLEKQNLFLKQHLTKIQQDFNSLGKNCQGDCTKQIQLFRNKYINKSKQLSKIKVQLTKEIWKQKFIKDINTNNHNNDRKQNNTDRIQNNTDRIQHHSDRKQLHIDRKNNYTDKKQSLRELQKQQSRRSISKTAVKIPHLQINKYTKDDDALSFRLTQNDEETKPSTKYDRQNIPPSSYKQYKQYSRSKKATNQQQMNQKNSRIVSYKSSNYR